MNINHLFYLMRVYETGSVNKAAAELYLSQSNLSNMIKSMETEMGYPLFSRTNKGMVPTPEGQLFMQHAMEMLKVYDHMQMIPRRAISDDTLRISCVQSSLFSELYFAFCRKYPGTKGQDIYRECIVTECLQDLVRYQSRMAIFYTSSAQRQKYLLLARQYHMQTILLKEHVHILCMMSKNHPLADCDSIDISMLPKYSMVTYEGLAQSDILEICGLDESSHILYVNSRALFTEAITENGYLAPSLPISQTISKNLGCVCKPVTNYNDDMEICLWIPQGYEMNSREKQYVEYLKQGLHSLV